MLLVEPARVACPQRHTSQSLEIWMVEDGLDHPASDAAAPCFGHDDHVGEICEVARSVTTRANAT